MDIITFLLFLLWLACGVLVVRFVIRTGGTRIGKVAHWFGGVFVMFGLAVGMVLVFARLNQNFGTRVNVYLLTHQLRPGTSLPLIQNHTQDDLVTVYRRGSINTAATLDGDRLVIDEQQTVCTSLWWMLWSKTYTTL
jgi:hypothetical protein